MSRNIQVFYTPKMVANYRCPSPSAAKPSKVVASWQKQFSIDIVEPTPVSLEELCRAHNPDFVNGVLSLTRDNGFGDRSPEVVAALPYTSGAMLSAARAALLNKKVAVAPCSGFHHAEWSTPMGFCTFNGLMVTALALRNSSPEIKVGILDLDMHYGNGTDNIIKKLNIDWVTHFTGGLNYDRSDQASEFFSTRLPHELQKLSKCDIVLYQAGADPHIDDPYGGWLTTEQLRYRDELVFNFLSKANVPVAWNLAGGYQVERDGSIPKVLEIHDNTMRECVRVYG